MAWCFPGSPQAPHAPPTSPVPCSAYMGEHHPSPNHSSHLSQMQTFLMLRVDRKLCAVFVTLNIGRRAPGHATLYKRCSLICVVCGRSSVAACAAVSPAHGRTPSPYGPISVALRVSLCESSLILLCCGAQLTRPIYDIHVSKSTLVIFLPHYFHPSVSVSTHTRDIRR
jgi:hypothetical protein